MQKPVDPTLKAVLRQQMQAAGSMKLYAQQLKVDYDHLRKVYEGIIQPGTRLLKRMGLKKVTRTFYVSAGAREEEPTVTQARLYQHLCDMLGASNHEEAVKAILTYQERKK